RESASVIAHDAHLGRRDAGGGRARARGGGGGGGGGDPAEAAAAASAAGGGRVLGEVLEERLRLGLALTGRVGAAPQRGGALHLGLGLIPGLGGEFRERLVQFLHRHV